MQYLYKAKISNQILVCTWGRGCHLFIIRAFSDEHWRSTATWAAALGLPISNQED